MKGLVKLTRKPLEVEARQFKDYQTAIDIATWLHEKQGIVVEYQGEIKLPGTTHVLEQQCLRLNHEDLDGLIVVQRNQWIIWDEREIELRWPDELKKRFDVLAE